MGSNYSWKEEEINWHVGQTEEMESVRMRRSLVQQRRQALCPTVSNHFML